MAIVLELLSRKNIPLKHYKFEQDYVCVGRDFNNDLRLDDPYVCPSHMLVAIDPESGLLMINDCQSTNGIKINNKFVTQATLSPNDVIKIGRTHLRIIDTKAPLPKAMPLSELEENLTWLNKAFLTVCLSFLCISYLLLSEYINSVKEFTLVTVLPAQLGQLALISLWPLCFAVLAKVVKKESHIVNQINLTLLVTLLFYGLNLVQKVLIFNISPGAWFAFVEFLVFGVLLSAFIWLSLFIAFHQPIKRRNTIAFILSLVILAPLFTLSFLNNGEFDSSPNYDATLLAPAYNFTQSIETENFIDNSEALFARADKLTSK
ncbi:FHA domain-containing protein [Paraglaciecola sp.]|uniref:FHA domain-containing protein n=1 Tax=Paraglaciecola sp. TaxID=1920173 RepID=UPI0030F44531